MITLFDRASRHLWLAGYSGGSHDAPATANARIEVINTIPVELRRSLTWDQGREMADWPRITAATGMAVFFADPHSPWQRPTNENGNGLLRRWLPKSTNLATHAPADLHHIAQRINTIPRRTLNWHTAHDRYHAAVAMTG